MTPVEAHDHSSFIKTPQQLIVVVLLSFVVPIFGIVLLVKLVTGGPHADPNALKPEAVAARIQPAGSVELAGAGESAAAGAKSGEEVYKTVCAACHDTGAANAPKTGDRAAWAARVKAGQAQLTRDAINGIRAMPARGGNPSLSDEEVARAVVFMANQSGATFKEPAAAKPAAKAKSK